MFDCWFVAFRYLSGVSTIHEIESAITKLSSEEVHVEADWLQEYRDELWDNQIEADAKAGKFDRLISKAKAGNCHSH